MNFCDLLWSNKSLVIRVMDPTLFFQTLFSFCKEQSDADIETEAESSSETKNSQNTLDIKTAWSSIFNISNNDPMHLPIFLPLLKQYSLAVKDFQNFNTPKIEESINIASDNSLDFDKRLSSIAPAIYLISILPFENNIKVFKLLIDLSFIQIAQDHELPSCIMKILNLTQCSSLPDEVLESYLDIVESFINTNKFKSAIFIFSYFASSTIEILPDSSAKISQWILQCLNTNSSQEEKIASLFLIKKSASIFGQNPTSFPINKIFALSLPLLVDKDKRIQKFANKAVKQMISSQICYTKQAATLIISQFSKYTEEQRPLFFGLLSRFLDNEETPQLAIVQKIYDFSIPLLKSEDPNLVAHGIEVLSEIASLSFDYIGEALNAAFDAAINLSSHKQYFSEISNFFLSISQNSPQYKAAQIEEKLPILVDSLTDEESGTRKKRLERAESLSSIIIGNKKEKVNTELLSKIIKFTIDSIEDGETIYICALVIALSKQLDEESAKLIFKKFEKLGREETDSVKLNSILHTMKKLMKLYSIDSIDFVTDILNGNIKYFGGLPVYTVQDPKTMIFLFITMYVRKFPQKSAEICDKLIDFVPNVSYVLLPSILEPIATGITTEIVSKDKTGQLCSSILETLDKLILDDDLEICACIEILRTVNKQYSSLDYPKTLTVLKQLLESSQENEELPLEGTIIHFIFELILNELENNSDAQLDNEFILNIVKKLPLPPQMRYSAEIMSMLTNDFMPNQEKFGFMSFQGLLSIVELLISQNISQYELPTDLVSKMKALLKQKLKEDKALERQISKSFQNSRPKQNRFSKLLKNL